MNWVGFFIVGWLFSGFCCCSLGFSKCYLPVFMFCFFWSLSGYDFSLSLSFQFCSLYTSFTQFLLILSSGLKLLNPLWLSFLEISRKFQKQGPQRKIHLLLQPGCLESDFLVTNHSCLTTLLPVPQPRTQGEITTNKNSPRFPTGFI